MRCRMRTMAVVFLATGHGSADTALRGNPREQ